jgi:hypothetical protein
MGREAIADVDYAGRRGRAKVLLESDALIVRAPVAARIARADLTSVKVVGDALILDAPDGPLSLVLGAVAAGRWLKAVNTPPPTLAAKLGLDAGAPVWTWGDLEDPALVLALVETRRVAAAEARLGLARVGSEADLAAALTTFADAPGPLWIVHGKGRSAFGDNAVRAVMRAGGWIDSKVCAVSETLSATRYGRRKA